MKAAMVPAVLESINQGKDRIHAPAAVVLRNPQEELLSPRINRLKQKDDEDVC